MKLNIDINGIVAEINKPSVVTGRNGVGKSSILNGVELAIYNTINGTRAKGEAALESKYLDKAKTLPLADIINCRFLDLSPIAKKKILLSIIDTKEIEKKLGEYWTGDVESSVKAINDKTKEVKKALVSTESKIETYEELKTKKEEELKTFKDSYDLDFNFKDTSILTTRINNVDKHMDAIVISGKTLTQDTCPTCKQSLVVDENNESMAEQLRKEYKEKEEEKASLTEELNSMIEYNATGKQIQENIMNHSKKKVCEKSIEDLDKNISDTIERLSELQNEPILELANYCKKELYLTIADQLKLTDFEIDMEKNFEISYKGRDYSILSRGQKFTANIYFSKAILEMVNMKIICIDDFEMIQKSIRDSIIEDIQDFEYLVSTVQENELTIN